MALATKPPSVCMAGTSDTNGTGVEADGASSNSPALTIYQGTFQVKGAGIGTGTTAFIQLTSAGNIENDFTTINNPVCNGNPNAILIVTHSYNPGGGTLDTYNNHPTGVFYTGSSWCIYNEDRTAMAANIAFNVLVIVP